MLFSSQSHGGCYTIYLTKYKLPWKRDGVLWRKKKIKIKLVNSQNSPWCELCWWLGVKNSLVYSPFYLPAPFFFISSRSSLQFSTAEQMSHSVGRQDKRFRLIPVSRTQKIQIDSNAIVCFCVLHCNSDSDIYLWIDQLFRFGFLSRHSWMRRERTRLKMLPTGCKYAKCKYAKC